MSADSDLPPRAISDMSVPASAAEIVLQVTPLEDSGANTADRYDWQAAMAAADGLALYLRMLGDDGALPADCEDRILCEWQEDWVLLDGGGAELVSCKHRDPAAGAFTTVNKLADEGGLAHLFNRWCALEEKPLCRASDVDVLVEFDVGPRFDYFGAYFGLKEGLEAILARPVDVVTAGSVRNPYFRARVEQTKETLYAA